MTENYPVRLMASECVIRIYELMNDIILFLIVQQVELRLHACISVLNIAGVV